MLLYRTILLCRSYHDKITNFSYIVQPNQNHIMIFGAKSINSRCNEYFFPCLTCLFLIYFVHLTA